METSISWVGAFFAGLISFLSPCVLPLVPAFLSFLAGMRLDEITQEGATASRRKILWPAFLFVLGFSTIFILMGASATLLGRWLVAYAGVLTKIAGILLAILGLHLTGLLRIPFLLHEHRFHTRAVRVSNVTAFLIGAAFAFGWSPCVGPLLAGILALAGTRETLGQGMVLLVIYSAGLGIPFLLAAAGLGTFIRWMQRFKAHFRVIEIAAGVLLIGLGALMFFGGMSRLAGWFGAFARFAV